MATLAEIEGVGSAYARKLQKAGVRGTSGLLKKGGTAKGRKELAASSGFSTKTLLEWVNRADLFRVRGVGAEFSDLLEGAGVDTVRELAKRDPAKLFDTLTQTNARKKLVRQTPSLNQVKAWVKQAKSLRVMVTY
jgi:predicted flap endonuclease-1-like 5' DNA nuclease